MEKIVVTPKNKAAGIFLKKLFSELESIDQIEVIEDGEVVDNELLKRMKKNLKGGYTTPGKVTATLNKIINQK
ncbi:MAG: hypothetical protein JJE09_14555 [Bacteroidia bacterium]|nr:hypothetical protein [Bacteroidia bacterium]